VSDTPRTDEQINGEPCTRFEILAGDCLRNAAVPSEFVRTLERELNAANERIKRLEEALDTLVKMHRSFIGKDDGITHERSYYCFYKGQYDHWKKAIDVLEAKEAKP
jgi:hypothetical protein